MKDRSSDPSPTSLVPMLVLKTGGGTALWTCRIWKWWRILFQLLLSSFDDDTLNGISVTEGWCGHSDPFETCYQLGDDSVDSSTKSYKRGDNVFLQCSSKQWYLEFHWCAICESYYHSHPFVRTGRITTCLRAQWGGSHPKNTMSNSFVVVWSWWWTRPVTRTTTANCSAVHAVIPL